MEISIRALVNLSIQLSIYAFIFGILGTLIVGIDQAITKGKFNLRESGLITKVGMACTLLAILGLAVAFSGFIFAGLWWIWDVFFEHLSPARLAVCSLIIGPSLCFCRYWQRQYVNLPVVPLTQVRCKVVIF